LTRDSVLECASLLALFAERLGSLKLGALNIFVLRTGNIAPIGHLPLDTGNASRLDVGVSPPSAGSEMMSKLKMNAALVLNESDLVERRPRRAGNLWLGPLAGMAALGMLLAVLVAGCATNSDGPPAEYSRLNLFPHSTNILDQGDAISITFRYSTNFNAVQKIGLDGMVNLEEVGEVMAEGKTVVQLEAELTALYKSQVKDDPISVKLVAAVAAVYVTGAVTRPGKIPMERRMTVLDAISEAGGFDPYRAKLSSVTVLRVDGERQRIYRLNLNRILAGEDEALFYLKPFDVVHVPTKTFNF
jgi:polysaccharide export outer membrane protein